MNSSAHLEYSAANLVSASDTFGITPGVAIVAGAIGRKVSEAYHHNLSEIESDLEPSYTSAAPAKKEFV